MKTLQFLLAAGMSVIVWSLLTAGQTYSSDSRYSLDFQHPNNYRLRVSRVRLQDRGYYHCQALSRTAPAPLTVTLKLGPHLLSALVEWSSDRVQLATHPPQLVWTYLDIARPQFRIYSGEAGREGRDLHYHQGSTISLVCQVEQAPLQQASLQWKQVGGRGAVILNQANLTSHKTVVHLVMRINLNAYCAQKMSSECPLFDPIKALLPVIQISNEILPRCIMCEW